MPARPRKPLLLNLTWAILALLSAAVAYLLSLGPASVIVVVLLRGDYGDSDLWIDSYNALYAPLRWLLERSPERVVDAYYSYLDLWQ
jgi:hypothetical protein